MTIDDTGVPGGDAQVGRSAQGVLDGLVWASLAGPHARFAERHGRAARYQPGISAFAGLEDPADERCWADGAELVGPGGTLLLVGVTEAPDGWERVFRLDGVQMIATSLKSAADPEAVVLGPEDVPEILDLVARTEPGPFTARTAELGTYLGIRRGGALVALAGERLRPPGWTEVSAVCTDPAHRGQGLAARLVRAVAAGIEERGEIPCLHAAGSNPSAIRLYESLGFTTRREVSFAVFKNIATNGTASE